MRATERFHRAGWISEDRCEVKRQEKENTRALEGVTNAPPSDVVALRRKLRTKQYFHRSLGYLYYFWHYPVCHCFRRDTAEQIGSGDRRCTRALMTAVPGCTANRRNEPIIEGTVVIFPEHRRWFPSAKTRHVIAFPICIDLAVSLFLSLPIHSTFHQKTVFRAEISKIVEDVLLWSRNSKLVTSRTSSRSFSNRQIL